MIQLEKNLNALIVIILSSVLWGAIVIQFYFKEEPCPLCLLQRLGMIMVGIGALLNIRFGIKKMFYGLSLIAALFGAFVALRQICLHICPGFPTFGKPFWGLNLYTWSFLVFASSIAYIALLLIGFSCKKEQEERMNAWHHIAFYLLFSVAATNIVTTFMECGLTACQG